jgi:hypothetical protein
MHVRKLFAVVALCLPFASGAMAQADATAPSQPQPTPPAASSAPAKKSRKSRTSKSKASKTSSSKKRRSSKKKAQAAAQDFGPVSSDVDPPQLTVSPVTRAIRGKPLMVTANAQDPSGIFGPILYVRKKGLGANDYVPIKMAASKIVPGEFSIDVPAALTNIDALEYYVEAWDMVGNGPARMGSAGAPLSVVIGEEMKVVVAPPPLEMKKGAPPAIIHAALAQALKGKPIEVNARLVGDSGVEGAVVKFRHAGEKEYRSLPMGNLGGDDYTATIPAAMATSDLEYYVEAYDKYGNGPARSGAPNAPYALKLTDATPPAVPAAAPAAVAAKEPVEPEPSPTYVGIGIDGGLPGGGGVTLLVRPLWWLRLNGGLAYNYAGLGYRGGISLAPGQWAVTPTLNLDAGHYVSGDVTKFVTFNNASYNVIAANTTYTFATAQIGLEFGSQRRFSFYVRGGLTYLMSTIPGAQLAAAANATLPDPQTTVSKTSDLKATSIIPCASVGFNLFIY